MAEEKVRRGAEALELLFARPDASGRMELPADPLLRRLAGAFSSAGVETPAPGAARAADYLNALHRELPVGENFASLLMGRIFETFIEHRVLPADLAAENWSADTRFLLETAAALLDGAAALPETLPEAERRRVLPASLALFAGFRPLDPGSKEALDALAAELAEHDRFRTHRVFRAIGGKFIPSEVNSAKPVDRFYGYEGVRKAFAHHFRAFSRGRSNLPLLINSLPGHGKTSLTVSYALDQPELVLVLPDPEALERGWSELVAPLVARPDHKFVLFFDDIDPRTTDWYNFRTHVGGAFSLPPNIMPVLAANYEFPANILSRGRKVSFPVFDEIRCTEMVEDFLKTFGMRKIPKNLVSMIAADYTEEFGQKLFTELSPRSLIRYLSIYEHDRIKRKTMVELSFGPMITRPDAELFHEFNIELMRSLYGEEYIRRLLKAQLKELE